MTTDQQTKLGSYAKHWESSEKGIEDVLAKETGLKALERFLTEAAKRGSYPKDLGNIQAGATETDVRALARDVLIKRKSHAHGNAACVIAECHDESELPATVVSILDEIHKNLTSASQATCPHP